MNSLVQVFTPDVLSLVVIVVFFVALFLVGLLFSSLRKTEFFKQNEMFIVAVGQKALDFILHAEYGEEYNSVADEYQTKANDRVAKGLYYVDPRMLFVIDKLESYVDQKFNVHLEFDDLLAIAESKYRTVKEDPSNTLLNS
jgi:hypothetical protein